MPHHNAYRVMLKINIQFDLIQVSNSRENLGDAAVLFALYIGIHSSLTCITLVPFSLVSIPPLSAIPYSPLSHLHSYIFLLLSTSVNRYATLECEHNLIRRACAKSEVRARGLERDVIRLQVPSSATPLTCSSLLFPRSFSFQFSIILFDFLCYFFFSDEDPRCYLLSQSHSNSRSLNLT